MNEILNFISESKRILNLNESISLLVNEGHVIKKYGKKYPDKIFYKINRNDKDAGLFSYYFTTLSHIIYAELKDWIPVIDMRNGYYYLLHEDQKSVGLTNVWDSYFTQPGGYELNNISKAANVITTTMPWAFGRELDFAAVTGKDFFFEILKETAKCIALNEEMTEYCKRVSSKLISNYENTLGLSYRLTYDVVKPKNHFVQPSLDEMCQIAEKLLNDKVFTNIFVATDDAESLEKIKKHFGVERVFHTERPRVGNKSIHRTNSQIDQATFETVVSKNKITLIENTDFGRNEEKFNRNRDYISEMETLAICGGLIGARTNGVMYALMRNAGRYRYVHMPTERYQ